MTREEFIQQFLLEKYSRSEPPIVTITEAIDAWSQLERALAPKEPKPLFENIL